MGSLLIATLFLRLAEKLFLPFENDLRPVALVEMADSPSDSEPELHLLLPAGNSLLSAPATAVAISKGTKTGV